MSNQIATSNNNVLQSVTNRVKEFQQKSEIHFPANYSPENALKSAWLILQETVDKDKKPVLQSCTQTSIANALLKMVTYGLNPSKNQCYFIAKGGKLKCDVSYHGEKAIAKSLPYVKDVNEMIVYGGDDFQYEIINGGIIKITMHKQKLSNIKPDNIMAAYCTIEKIDGSNFTVLMTWEQIKKSWEHSQGWDNEKNRWRYKTPHQEQPDQMALRTVIRRACKHFVGSSDDSNLLLKQYQAEYQKDEAEAIEEEISENANVEVLDVPFVDEQTGEIMEEQEETKTIQPTMAQTPDAPKW